MVLGLLFAGLTIRFLGDQRAGFLMTMQSVVALSGAVGGFGFGTAAVRKVAAFHAVDNFEGARSCLNAVLFFNLIVGVFMSAVIMVGFPWFLQWTRIAGEFRDEAFFACVFVALTSVIQQISATYAITYSALQRYDIIAILGFIFGFLHGGLGLLILSLFCTMSALACLSFILASTQFLINFVLVRRLLRGNLAPAWNPRGLRSMARFGGWAWLTSLGGMVNSSLDKIALTTLLGSASLPYYVVGQKVVSQVHNALATQSHFIFPMLAAKGNEAGLAIRRVEDRLRWFLSFASAVIYGSLVIVAHPLLSRLVGSDFADRAMVPFMLACFQGFLVAQSIVPYYISWAEERAEPNAVFGFVTGLLTFATIMWIAPQYGILGASLGQLWIGPTALALIGWVSWQGRRFSWGGIFRPLVSPTVTWIILLVMGWAFWVLQLDRRAEWWPLASVSAISAILAGMCFEYWIFRGFMCLETLKSAIKILVSRLIPVHSIK